MAEYVGKGAEPNETVLHTRTPNGYEAWDWLPVLECIVRCRDCKSYTKDEAEYYHYCGSWCEQVEPDGFCYRGERKEVDA